MANVKRAEPVTQRQQLEQRARVRAGHKHPGRLGKAVRRARRRVKIARRRNRS